MKRRVLILHIPVGSGHTRAAQAIASGLKRLEPDTTVVVRDAFKYINRAVAAAAMRVYMDVIRVTPAVWSYVYRQAERSAFSEMGRQELAGIIRTLSAGSIMRLLDDTDPDTILCTHPFPLALIAELKRRNETEASLVGVITDFTVHPFWLYDEVNHYTVPAESLLVSPSFRYFPEERLWLTGIPIEPEFGDPMDSTSERQALSFSQEDKLVLVMGGGLGLGPLEHVVASLLEQPSLKILVVAGKNPGLVRSLGGLESEAQGRLRVFGYVSGVQNLMGACDILITKAGGLTAAEALAKQLPMIILSPIPGQEQRNADFLINRGAAARVESPREASYLANLVLSRPRLRDAMVRACTELGRPRAALDVAGHILGR